MVTEVLSANEITRCAVLVEMTLHHISLLELTKSPTDRKGVWGLWKVCRFSGLGCSPHSCGNNELCKNMTSFTASFGFTTQAAHDHLQWLKKCDGQRQLSAGISTAEGYSCEDFNIVISYL